MIHSWDTPVWARRIPGMTSGAGGAPCLPGCIQTELTGSRRWSERSREQRGGGLGPGLAPGLGSGGLVLARKPALAATDKDKIGTVITYKPLCRPLLLVLGSAPAPPPPGAVGDPGWRPGVGRRMIWPVWPDSSQTVLFSLTTGASEQGRRGWRGARSVYN